MDLKLLVTLLLIQVVVAKISLNVNIKNKEAELTYEGSEASPLTDSEIRRLIRTQNLRLAFMKKLSLTESYRNSDACGPANRVLSIKSATVKHLKMQPVIVVSQNFENPSNHTVKVNAGISHTVQNTLTTSWSKEREQSETKEVACELNVMVSAGVSWGPVSVGAAIGTSISSSVGHSFTLKRGVNQEISRSETIGTTSGVEVELKPGDAVTAVLSANAGSFEMEVVHQDYIKGDVPIHCNCDIQYRTNKNVYSPGFREVHVGKVCESIEDLIKYGGLNDNFTRTETIKYNFYVEGKVSVHERKRGQRRRRRVSYTPLRNATQ